MSIPHSQTAPRLHGPALIRTLALASGLVAGTVAGVVTLGVAPADFGRTALIAGAVSLLAAVPGAMLIAVLGASRPCGAPPAFGVLASSILRMFAAVGFGIAATYLFAPAVAPFWAAIVAGWVAGKVVEVRRVWPVVFAAAAAPVAVSIPTAEGTLNR